MIKALRRRRGLSRAELAKSIGVSSQTILNLERDPDYNLGIRLMRRLEQALNAEFVIELKENTVNERICMGNDEFILHVRKHYEGCELDNPTIGRRVWTWLRDNANGEQVSGQQPALWGTDNEAVDRVGLPGSATQFEFDLDGLSDLYRFLRILASRGDTEEDGDDSDDQ